MVWAFSMVTMAYAREAVTTGAVWLITNWILDIVVLIGLLGMTPWEYGVGIGLRTMIIPAMVIPAGITDDHAVERAGNETMRNGRFFLCTNTLLIILLQRLL
jgi:hypothetical protein